MIIGLTRWQKAERRQARLARGWFAWRPVRLYDGRWAWFERVDVEEHVTRYLSGIVEKSCVYSEIVR